MEARNKLFSFRTRGRFALAARRLLGLSLALLLVAASASPQGAPAPSAGSGSAASGSKSAPPKPDKARAQQALQTGRHAEQSGDWATAYASYSEAASYDPGNRQYRQLRTHAQFQLVQNIVSYAEREALAGDIASARTQLNHALQVDPTFDVARERLQEIGPDSPAASSPSGPRLAGLPHLHPTPGTKNFDVHGSTRTVYQELGRQFGITVAFDGDLSDRSVRFRAPGVDFETALMVLSRQTRTYTRVADDHTLFVTDDTAQKVKEYAPEIEKTVVLPNSITTEDMNEIVRTIRDMTGITRTQLNASARTITLRSTQENVALAEAILRQIEKPAGEMMLEVEILEVDRNLAHQLGIIPPTSEKVFTLSLGQIRQLQQAQNNGTLLQVIQTIFGTASVLAASGAMGAVFPPVLAFGGGKTIFLATMPSVTANFSQTLSAVRSAQRILLRAQDGKSATFFVGDRFPVDLQLLSTGASQEASAITAGLLAGVLPRTDYPVGSAPVSVAVATFGNGNQDIVTANHGDGTVDGSVSILLGGGDGTFGTQIPITIPGAAAHSTPTAVAVGDFNNDGNVDLAVTDSANNTVNILLGDGNGGFTGAVSYRTGSGPVALAVEDINRDGIPDLCIVNQGDGTTAGSVSILIGQGTAGLGNGTFSAKTDFPVGLKPSAIVSADFNGDGLPDLAVTNANNNNVSILLQNADHSFAKEVSYATGTGPAGIAAADFNRDGFADLAITNQADGTVSILLGNNTGTFATQTAYNAGSGPTGLLAQDFTGDGLPDLVVADQAGDNVSVVIGNGDGTFTNPLSLPTGNAPTGLAAADLNNDGTLDLVSANQSSNSATVTLNTAESSLGLASSAGQTQYPSAEYIDLGLKVKATPRLHDNDEVTLHLEFDIRSLAGSSINGVPILTNRTVDQTLRLREDETSVMTGIVSSNESKTLSGWPGLAATPIIGYVTGQRTTSQGDTELLILVTPRALRLPSHIAHSIYAGRGEPATPPTSVTPPPGQPPIRPGVPAQQPPAPGEAQPQPGPPQQPAPQQQPGLQPQNPADYPQQR